MKIIRETPWLRSLAIFALLFSFTLMTGCNGCSNSKLDKDALAKKKAEEEKKKKEKKKPDFDVRTAVLLPGVFPEEKKEEKEGEEDDEKEDDEFASPTDKIKEALERAKFSNVRRVNRTKLGHWVTANFQVIANNYNADGQLTANCIDGQGRPVAVPSTDYYLSTTRPASLPKGEWKNLETNVFLPRRNLRSPSAATIDYGLERNTGGLTQLSQIDSTIRMKPCTHHMVVLSSRPDTYKYLSLTDAVALREQMSNGERVPEFYVVVPSRPGDPVPLPAHSLNWTTIAYLIWDDYDPESLSKDHQTAILDWLHFGGQLILSGPDCLEKLQTSFLGDYLPAQVDEARNLTSVDVEELNKNWTIPIRKAENTEARIFNISDKVPLLGVSFKPHDRANFVDGTGEIAIERRVGRGRIVATAFSINSPVVVSWQSYPSFLHNVLLRKPNRTFYDGSDLDISFYWEGDRTSIFDPLMGTTLRFLSRDLASSGTPKTPTYELNQEIGESDFSVAFGGVTTQEVNQRRKSSVPQRDEENYLHFGGFADAPQSGACGWNDDSGISKSARETLKEAAGITPPSSGFVLKMLAAYLLVLVPINWAVFRLMGRVEWAWIAAPFIAIIGAFLVVRMASLDIGFVRSNTQIGLLEVHGSYDRGHVTEYSALYTSLSTPYDVELDNPTAQSLPFAEQNEAGFVRKEETLSRVRLRKSARSRLEGFRIQSNTTGLLHSEYMLDLDGGLSCNYTDDGIPEILNNGSFIDLESVGVLWRDQDLSYHIAWVGDVAAGSASGDLKFDQVAKSKLGERWRTLPTFSSSKRLADEIWNKNVATDQKEVSVDAIAGFPEIANESARYTELLLRMLAGEDSQLINRRMFRDVFRLLNVEAGLRIGRVFDTVVENLSLAPGECRMIGSTSQKLGRTKFDPEATQTDQQTLVVVHLKHPELPPARRDTNSITDFKVKSTLDWEAEMEALQDSVGQ